jgi:hypothetical protein
MCKRYGDALIELLLFYGEVTERSPRAEEAGEAELMKTMALVWES